MKADEEQFLLFSVCGGELLATPVGETIAIRQVPAHAQCGEPLREWPAARAVAFADSVMPILDLSLLLGQDTAAPVVGHPLLIVRTGLAEIGLLVDEVVCVRCARPQVRAFSCTLGSPLFPPLRETIDARVADELKTVAVVHVGAMALTGAARWSPKPLGSVAPGANDGLEAGSGGAHGRVLAD